MISKRGQGESLIVIIIVVAVCLLTIGEIVRELSCFHIFRYSITNEKLLGLGVNGKKLVFLSDLHNKCYGTGNAKLLTAIRKERPDMILIGGDMLIGNDGYSYQETLSFIEQLPAICPVYYALGNHEQRMKEHPERYRENYFQYKKLLQDAGVCFVENSCVSIMEQENNAIRLNIYGLEIPKRCYKHIGKEVLLTGEIRQCIGTADPKGYNIMLAHNPEYVTQYLEWGADLVLSGHLHGGVVRIPGLTGVIAPNLRLFPKYSGGRYREKNGDVVVSRGLGNHTIYMRLFNPAELTVIMLGNTKKNDDF